MDIQSILTITIEVVFWALTGLIIFDFINGLYGLYIVPFSPVAFTQSKVISESMASVLIPQLETIPNPEQLEVKPQQIPSITPKAEQLPDPWELELDPQPQTAETQSIVLPFSTSTLRLLPPVKEVQQKSKRATTKKTTSTAKATSTKAESPRKPGRPRKQVA